MARKSALSLRAKNGQIIALDALKFEAPKTKDFKAMMAALKIADKKALFVLPAADDYALLSARNLQNVNLITVNELNTYAIMNSTAVVVLPETLTALDETFKA